MSRPGTRGAIRGYLLPTYFSGAASNFVLHDVAQK
jgi:hypothetical protein